MSTRNRLSMNRPTPSQRSVAPTSDELPPYKKPSHPLDYEAQSAIRNLKGPTFNHVKEHNKKATEIITETAGSVNDMLRDHESYIERRRKKWDAGKSLDDREDEEKGLQELQERVDEATEKLEESMRAVIDGGISVERTEEALEWLRQSGTAQLQAQYNTQMTQRNSQRQAFSQSQRMRDDDDDDDEDDISTPGPTPLDGSRITLTGTSEMFTDRMQRKKNEYTSMSLTTRYARNNDYRNFKRMVHDAKYGDGGKPLAHEDSWFTETGAPAPGITNTQRGDFDDDDDIIVDKATISTRCPLTFQQFKEPYTSTKCPHTFEKNAILEIIRRSVNRLGGGGHRGQGERATECPVTGCDQMLTAHDLHADPILIRKIKRMQQAEAAEASDSDDDDDDDDTSMPPPPSTSQRAPTQSTPGGVRDPRRFQPPRSSIVEDLGDPSDEDDE